MKIIYLLLGIMIGVGIGYIGSNFIQPYAEPYTFETALTINASATNIILGETSTIQVDLTVTLPSQIEMLKDYIDEYLLQQRPIRLMVKETSANYWTFRDTKITTYSDGLGSITFIFSEPIAGTYQVRALFEGSNLLKGCTSGIETIIVS